MMVGVVARAAPMVAAPRLTAEWLTRPAAGRGYDPGRGTLGDLRREVVFRVRLTWDVRPRAGALIADERQDVSDVESWLGWWSAADASPEVAGGAR